MLTRTRNFFVRLHKDETGPNTVEWVLLIIVGLLVLLGIFAIATFVINRMSAQQDNVGEGTDLIGGATDSVNSN